MPRNDEPINTSMNTVIVFADMGRSVDKNIEHGDDAAASIIQQRLQDIESSLRRVDPAFKRISGTGDGWMCFGENAIRLFEEAVKIQAIWKAWPTPMHKSLHMAAKIAIGIGSFPMSADGDYHSTSINLTRRILDFCPEQGVVVTEAVRAIIQTAGYSDKLIRVSEKLKGFPGEESYYEVDGEFLRTEGSRIPVRERDAIDKGKLQQKPVAVDDNVPVKEDKDFWKIFGVLVAIFVTIVVVASFYIYYFEIHK